MAYQTYTTEAIVCGSFNRNGADRQYRLFTKHAGMLFATAKSVRYERSKQRHALQTFSHVNVSLVRGKGGWRIGSVEAITNHFFSAHNRQARTLLVSVVRLLNRYLHGEEVHPAVFGDLIDLLSFARSVSLDMSDDLLMIFELRLLAHLGYIRIAGDLGSIIESKAEYDVLLTQITDSLKREVDRAIVTGRDASHL